MLLHLTESLEGVVTVGLRCDLPTRDLDRGGLLPSPRVDLDLLSEEPLALTLRWRFLTPLHLCLLPWALMRGRPHQGDLLPRGQGPGLALGG